MNNKELYRKICGEKKGLPVFMQPWWLDVVCGEWDAAIVKNGEETAGAWPYPVEKKMGVVMLRTPVVTPYLGPHIFYPPDLKGSRLDSFEHDVIAELMQQLPGASVWHLSIAPGIMQAGLFKRYKLRVEVQQTFLLRLRENEATLFANIKESARRNIRQAEKEITITDDKSYLEQLYAFQKNTLTQKGKKLAYPLHELDKIMGALQAHDACALWVAKSGDTVEAIVWQVWDDNQSYYFMGGQNPEANGYKAMSLLLWHGIKASKNMGHSIFDLEGSMDEGVERFFRNFGGERALYIVLRKNDSLLWKLKKRIFR